MFFFTLVVCFFIFLYCLYKFTKDDYQFIRKNISPEHIFDIVFVVVWIALFFARLIFFLEHSLQDKDLLTSFFSVRNGGFSLSGGILGGSLSLLLIGRYRKVPLGRMFDFFSLALLFALPIGFTGYALYLKSNISLLYGAIGLLYLVLLILFMRFLYPRVMNRSIREGNLSLYFLLVFSLLSLFTAALRLDKSYLAIISINTFILVCYFFICLTILLKREGGRLSGRVGTRK